MDRTLKIVPERVLWGFVCENREENPEKVKKKFNKLYREFVLGSLMAIALLCVFHATILWLISAICPLWLTGIFSVIALLYWVFVFFYWLNTYKSIKENDWKDVTDGLRLIHL